MDSCFYGQSFLNFRINKHGNKQVYRPSGLSRRSRDKKVPSSIPRLDIVS